MGIDGLDWDWCGFIIPCGFCRVCEWVGFVEFCARTGQDIPTLREVKG